MFNLANVHSVKEYYRQIRNLEVVGFSKIKLIVVEFFSVFKCHMSQKYLIIQMLKKKKIHNLSNS